MNHCAFLLFSSLFSYSLNEWIESESEKGKKEKGDIESGVKKDFRPASHASLLSFKVIQLKTGGTQAEKRKETKNVHTDAQQGAEQIGKKIVKKTERQG